MEKEEWKPLEYGSPMDHHYQVSSHGRIRSAYRTYQRVSRYGSLYTTVKQPHILAKREFKGYQAVALSGEDESGRKIGVTCYIHRAVAIAFVTKENANFDKVTFKDRNISNIYYKNLEWTSQSILSTRTMSEASTERRNFIGQYNTKRKGQPKPRKNNY